MGDSSNRGVPRTTSYPDFKPNHHHITEIFRTLNCTNLIYTSEADPRLDQYGRPLISRRCYTSHKCYNLPESVCKAKRHVVKYAFRAVRKENLISGKTVGK